MKRRADCFKTFINGADSNPQAEWMGGSGSAGPVQAAGHGHCAVQVYSSGRTGFIRGANTY